MAWGKIKQNKQSCPRCGAEINLELEQCPYCGRVMAEPVRSTEEVLALEARRQYLSKQIADYVAHMPLLSIPSPPGWDFRALGLVTAQTVTGTGVLSDVTSQWTDFFGLQSGVFRDKLRAGENLCKDGLRLDALGLGGHAVIGIDVDYAEVGNSKMLMVCMTGTAIRLESFDPLEKGVAAKLAKAVELLAELQSIRI